VFFLGAPEPPCSSVTHRTGRRVPVFRHTVYAQRTGAGARSSFLFTEVEGIDMISKCFTAIDKILTFFEEWSLFVSVMIALVALFINVVLRYGFNYSLAWSEELVREVIIYTTLIGCSAAVKNRSMIKIDAMVQLVPVLKRPLTFFSNAVTLVFSYLVLHLGWQLAVLQVQTQQKTIILQIPYVYIFAILPLMGAMMLLRTLQVIFEDIRDMRSAAAAPDTTS
jgi:TRAP-type C4-dicarboxylate transport system permease small subunit